MGPLPSRWVREHETYAEIYLLYGTMAFCWVMCMDPRQWFDVEMGNIECILINLI